MNDISFGTYRDREYRVIMTGIGVVGGLGLTCSMLPAVDICHDTRGGHPGRY